MHLLVAQSGTIDDGSEPRDLGQSPGDIVVLSAADTELALLSHVHGARSKAGAKPSLRLANLLHLKHNYSVDLYIEKTLVGARIVVVRLLGGKSYWEYGIERLASLAREGAFELVVLPGDDKPDISLEGLSSVDDAERLALWAYLSEGGAENAGHFLDALSARLEQENAPPAARPLLKAGFYWPGADISSIEDIECRWTNGSPVAAVVFYRALMQSGDLDGVDGLIAALRESGLNPLPIYVASLRDPVCAEVVRTTLSGKPPDVILNATAFATTKPGDETRGGLLAEASAPVLQVVFGSETEDVWRQGTRGLSPRDIAMHVSLPEIDGRLLSRAVSFKADAEFDERTEHYVVRARSDPGRARFVVRQAAQWARLRQTPARERQTAIVLANYPNRDARIANGVGLDTPASAIALLDAMAGADYDIQGAPTGGNALIESLMAGATNAGRKGRIAREFLPLDIYRRAFEELPQSVRAAVTERWGVPEADPLFADGAFAITVQRFGKAVIGIQPARGYNIDPKATYHDPALVPPHGYFAFYFWLREVAGIHAVVHLGKHGNLEWLPGKALALSEECFPEAVLGAVPNIYPFIVNDPGEGAQAKRRTSAVIIDHLTPPLTRAETYGPLKALETLVDEYYEAAGLDERRRVYLAGEILMTAQRLGLDKDCGIEPDADEDTALQELDNHLCELKEMQIRDGLHVFGSAPEGDLRTDLLVALARVPRGTGSPGEQSLIRALALDLGLDGFDPLDCRMGEAWEGRRPKVLADLDRNPWRSAGDTIERLELLARALVAGERTPEPGWAAASAVLDTIVTDLAPKVAGCGTAEINGILTALNGRFVEPGPSGAPTRGRPDVLPTGRNFFSMDSRALPTPAAWELGRKSAELVIERYVQDHGNWPRALALSAWGTSNMRTGGDDIAQALALMGAQPEWEPASGRVTGFSIVPLAVLGRPRVDVTFRISGFFRDAFPAQIDLLDSAVRAIAALDEEEGDNPLAARVRADRERFAGDGLDEDQAGKLAGARVFGSMPGAYGAGLQALIDEKLWDETSDLADAYVTWGQYAYGAKMEGQAARAAFESRLGAVDAVLHNQDNREHDILDSDDYYQFEGGLAAAVQTLKGAPVKVYHNDHSRPERPVVRALEEEIGRVVRARAANPKWIAGVMRHGYKGAFEIAATVDYLFAFAATTGAVGQHHFEALFEAYVEDQDVRDFLAANNRAALSDIVARFDEAIERGLWTPRRNSVHDALRAIGGEAAS